MKLSARHMAVGLLLALPWLAQAEISNGVVKLGVLTDLSSIFSDYGGEGNVLAVRMAVEDFGGEVNGKKVEVISADFQNKPDVSLAIARKWIDQDGVDAIIDAPNSSVAIAMNGLARDKNKVFMTSALSSDLTGKYCTPNNVQFAPDTYALAAVAATALVQQGQKTWYSVTADYAFGHAMERDVFAIVKAGGGKAIGSVRHPFGASDMSSFVLQAQASKAQVLSIASAGGDVQSVLRAVSEYGVNKSMKVAALMTELLDANRLGRRMLAGTFTSEGWYWDMNEETRAFARRFSERHPKRFYPSRSHAGLYGMTLEYLKAVKALDDDRDGKVIVDKMKSTPINNMFAKNAVLRQDGRLLMDTYLVQIKAEDEPKKNEWDLYRIVTKVPPEKAFRPLSQSECPLVRKQ